MAIAPVQYVVNILLWKMIKVTQSQSQKLESELGYYKESNTKLQFEIDKEKYFNDLINTKLKYHIQESTKQIKEFEIAEKN